MNLGLRSKVAIVTGASRGLGRAMTMGLAEEGCHISICARGKEALDRTAQEIRATGAEVLALAADMTVPQDIQRLIEETVRTFGRLDILVNNVGGGRGGREPSDQDWQGALDVNLFAAIRTSRLALPQMRRQGWGRVINISSIWGREAGGGATYNAAKAAVISFSKSLAAQVASDGITVNAVCPGSIAFPGGGWARRLEQDPEGMAGFIRQNIPGGRFGTAEEVAAVVVFLASERASWVTGAAITVDGGQSRSLI